MESGGQWEKLSCQYGSQYLYLSSLAGCGSTLPPLERERFFFCLATSQPMRDCYNSASEKSLYFKLPVSSNGLRACQQLFQASPCSFIRQHSSSLSRFAYSFCYSMLNPNCKSLLFLKKNKTKQNKTKNPQRILLVKQLFYF